MAMSAERKAELSAKGKKRWADAKAIGLRTGRPTEQVHNAYGAIVRAGLLEVALSEESTMDQLLKVMEIVDKKIEVPVKVYESESEDEGTKTPAQQIKVAMWFITKIGSPEQAIRAIKAAAAAIKALETSSKD